MIDRNTDVALVRTALKRSRIVALPGPRQCGKTTLAREFVAADSHNIFDLEDPTRLARLNEPDTALRPLKGLVVIDAIQRRPDLLPLLRVLADGKERNIQHMMATTFSHPDGTPMPAQQFMKL